MSRTEKIITIQTQLQTFSTYVYLFQQQIADKMNLHPTDFHSIHLLDKYKTLTAGELAACLGLTSGATTAVIDRLAELGYAERAASGIDRRSTIVRLLPDGIKKMRNEYSLVEKQIDTYLGQLSDTELDSIDRFLRTIVSI